MKHQTKNTKPATAQTEPAEPRSVQRMVRSHVKPSTAWAIASGRAIMPWTVRSTRKEAIRSMEQNWQRPWAELRAQGASAVKIRMTPNNHAQRTGGA